MFYNCNCNSWIKLLSCLSHHYDDVRMQRSDTLGRYDRAGYVPMFYGRYVTLFYVNVTLILRITFRYSCHFGRWSYLSFLGNWIGWTKWKWSLIRICVSFKNLYIFLIYYDLVRIFLPFCDKFAFDCHLAWWWAMPSTMQYPKWRRWRWCGQSSGVLYVDTKGSKVNI